MNPSPPPTTADGTIPPPPAWLDRAVFYHIYVQSFFDSNGDGIGDLNGIIAKLDYLQELGCTALWLSPIFDSPFQDAGYDVRDHFAVAPRYGTMDDLQRLIELAHRKDIKVCLDIVPGHVSIEHPWFQESAQAPTTAPVERCIWTDNVWSEPPPGNWVQGYGRRNGRFLSNFFWFQPALNYGFAAPSHPGEQGPDDPGPVAMRHELTRLFEHWLNLGIDGFRVDMAYSMIKRDDADYTATSAFWRKVLPDLRRRHPQCAFISEWSSPRHAINAGFHLDFMIHFGDAAYMKLLRHEPNRDILRIKGETGPSYFSVEGSGDAVSFFESFNQHRAATKQAGLVAIPSGNHDIGRLSIDRSEPGQAGVFALIFTLPSVPFIYYGDEIGLPYHRKLASHEGGYSRTGSRVPMAWNHNANHGFSTAAADQLYLPAPGHDSPTVAQQSENAKSLLATVRRLSALRKTHPALAPTATFELIPSPACGYPLAYWRHTADATPSVLVVINPRGVPATIELPQMDDKLIELEAFGTAAWTRPRPGKSVLTLPGESFVIYEFDAR